MKKLETPSTVKTLTPQDLATRMSISPRRLRQILRAEYPREVKGKNWEIPMEMAKKVEKGYKEKVKAREQKHRAEIEKELESG